MRFFWQKKKSADVEEPQPFTQMDQQRFNDLMAEAKAVFARYPVGKQFQYLGHTLAVKEHWQPFLWSRGLIQIIPLEESYPRLVTEYFGADGVLHHKTFTGQQFTAMGKDVAP